METHELIGGKKVKELIDKYQDYRIFVQVGFAYRGAREEEDDKQDKKMYLWREGKSRIVTFHERMVSLCDNYAAYDVEIDHNAKKLHINAFTENDMY